MYLLTHVNVLLVDIVPEVEHLLHYQLVVYGLLLGILVCEQCCMLNRAVGSIRLNNDSQEVVRIDREKYVREETYVIGSVLRRTGTSLGTLSGVNAMITDTPSK